jgi:hypothetical protein
VRLPSPGDPRASALGSPIEAAIELESLQEHARDLRRTPFALASRSWDALIVQASCNSPL